MVGCVIIESGEIIGEGWHEVYGGPHAERNAIRNAVERGQEARLREATLYVNLEPCNHFGQTPPCTNAILEYRIPRVVVGSLDPNPLVAGSGVGRLRDAGIDVSTGDHAKECFRLNEAFFHHVRTCRPLVTLKIAQTLDAQVATRTGDSRWVSSEHSRRIVHQWRSELDAVMIGAGTALADDPALTVRLSNGRQPWRVVLDRQGRLSESLTVFTDEHADRTIVYSEESARKTFGSARHPVVRTATLRDDRLDLTAVLEDLGRGDIEAGMPKMQSVLVEAGPGLATALIERDLVDRYFVFIAPKIVGAGTPSIASLGIDLMASAVRFADVRWQQVGPDMLFQGFKRPVSAVEGTDASQ